jgi:ferritin-like metal-binding protein YciE
MSLHALLVDELRDLYNAEKQLTKALPKLAKAASHADLKELIEAHLDETENQVSRLEQVFELLNERARGKHCAGIAGIIEEGSTLLDGEFDGAVLDAGIIAGAQRAEHYEIGAYGSVIAWAQQLGLQEVATLLKDTLAEEEAADQKLSALAEGEVNIQAAGEEEAEEEETGSGRMATAGAGRRAQGSRRSGNGSKGRR